MIFAVLTVLDQSDRICSLLERLEHLEWPVQVIVVDDGSRDGTPGLVEHYPGLRGRLRLVQHVRQHGAGVALLAGLRQALLQSSGPEDLVLTFPPGGAPDLAPAEAIVRCLEEGADVVIASRFAAGGGEPGLGRWASLLGRTLAAILRVFFPLAGVRDYTSNYRGIRMSLLERAFRVHGRTLVTCAGDPGPAEFLVRLGRMGVRVVEVPWCSQPDGRGRQKGRFGLGACLAYARLVLGLLGFSRRTRTRRA